MLLRRTNLSAALVLFLQACGDPSQETAGAGGTGSAASLLRRNLLVYGLGGIVMPFAGIKLIDLAVSALHLA